MWYCKLFKNGNFLRKKTIPNILNKIKKERQLSQSFTVTKINK